MRWVLLRACLATCGTGCSGSTHASQPTGDAGCDANEAGTPPPPLPPWLTSATIFVDGVDVPIGPDCRAEICRHNENTDMTAWNGSIYLVHRTAISQTLGPNSALHVYRSNDGGTTFAQTALIPAPVDRDLRDPSFFQVGGELYVKAITRLPVASARDSNVDSITVVTHSADGATWTPLANASPPQESFWRVKQQGSTYYAAAYHDGDTRVDLFTSTDGLAWTQGAPIYTISSDTPLETELTFMPSGRMLALVRMDGSDAELLGDQGRLRTKICWAAPPYVVFDCSAEFDGQRLDGPLTFFDGARLFVVARKHLQGTGRKRTSLFEIQGTLEGGPISVVELGELPSAGDTSYAGVATVDAGHVLLSWYSGDLAADRPWVLAMFDATNIWLGTVDLTKL
jgi:hypothetical protein